MTNSTSQSIADFLNFIDDVQSQYKFCYDAVNKQDKLTQDYLHSLELDNLKCSERSKVATQLAINRKDRRYYKNRVEELDPVIQWIEDPNSVRALNLLKQVLGSVRKQENYHKDRTYVPRVLKENKYEEM